MFHAKIKRSTSFFFYVGLTYVCFPKRSQKKFGSFERKIIRRTFGPVQNNGAWRTRRNEALHRLYKENDWQPTHLLKDHSGLDI